MRLRALGCEIARPKARGHAARGGRLEQATRVAARAFRLAAFPRERSDVNTDDRDGSLRRMPRLMTPLAAVAKVRDRAGAGRLNERLRPTPWQTVTDSLRTNADSPPSGHATITVLRAVAAVAKRRAVFAGRHACPHR